MTQVSTSATNLYTFLISLIITGLMTACSQQVDTIAPVETSSARLENIVVDSSATLKSVSNFPVGSLFNAPVMNGDTKVRNVVSKDFSALTVPMFMNVQDKPGKYLFNIIDRRVGEAEKYGVRLHGHCLVYHEAAPNWLTQTKWSTDEFESIVKNHIQTVVGRYKGRVKSWDVINEVIDRQTGKMKQTVFRKLYPSDEAYMEFVKLCFVWAHEADPNAKLFYNDWGYEQFQPMLPAVLKMITEFKRSGTPVHGIGTQMHININTPDQGIRNSLQVLASTGLLIHVSELDIAINPEGNLKLIVTDKVLQSQATKYQAVAKSYKQFVPDNQKHGITLWGVQDDDSSLLNGEIQMRLLFDTKFDKKHAYFGFASGLKS